MALRVGVRWSWLCCRGSAGWGAAVALLGWLGVRMCGCEGRREAALMAGGRWEGRLRGP